MFYLTMHSTHFIYGYMASDMVKDHSDSEKGNLLPPHRLLLSINSKGSFIWSTGWNEKYFNGSIPWRIDPTTHRTMSECSTSELHPTPWYHRDNQRGKLLLPLHKLLFLINKESFILPSRRQDRTYHSLCYVAMAGTRNSPMGTPLGIEPMTHYTRSRPSTTELHHILSSYILSDLWWKDH